MEGVGWSFHLSVTSKGFLESDAVGWRGSYNAVREENACYRGLFNTAKRVVEDYEDVLNVSKNKAIFSTSFVSVVYILSRAAILSGFGKHCRTPSTTRHLHLLLLLPQLLKCLRDILLFNNLQIFYYPLHLVVARDQFRVL